MTVIEMRSIFFRSSSLLGGWSCRLNGPSADAASFRTLHPSVSPHPGCTLGAARLSKRGERRLQWSGSPSLDAKQLQLRSDLISYMRAALAIAFLMRRNRVYDLNA